MKIGSLLIDMAVDLARLRSDMDQVKNTVDGAMRDMARAAGNLKKLLGGVGAALALIGSGGAFARITSEMTDYEARLARVVGGHDAARAAMGRLNDMAMRTYSDFGQTAESYLQNEGALRAMGYSTRQTMDYVETLNNALVVSGAKGERAAQVQLALQKAMMLGKLSGDQLNTVIASGGRVAELLAEKLGVTTNELLALGAKGKITGSVIYEALVGNMQKIRKEAEEMPATILDGFGRIGTAVNKLVYDFDTATGASAGITRALVWVADNMGLIVQWGTPVAAALLAIAAPTIISGVLAVATALAKAAADLALLAVANPLVTLAAGAAAAVAALVVFRDEIKLGVDETATLADLGKAAFDDLTGGATTLWDTVKSAFAGQRDEITKTNTVAADSAAAQEASWLAMVRSVLVAFDAMGGFVRGFFAGWGETIAAVTSATIDRFMGMGRAVRKVLMGDITGALAELQTSAALDVKQIFLDAMDRSFESQKSSGLEARLDQWVASARAASAAAAAAAKNVGDAGDDAGKKITTLADNIKKAKDEFAELMARLNAKDAGVDPKFAEELAILKKGLDAGRIGMDAYIITVQRLIGQQQFAKDAAAAEAKAFDDLMAAQDKAREKNEGQIRTGRQMLEQIKFETSLLKMNTRERTVATAMRELERQGIVKGTQAYEAYAEQIRAALIDKDTIEATIKAQDEVAEGWKRTSEQIGQQFTDALIQGGASVKEALKRMFQNMVLRPIIQPVMTLAGGIIASFLGGGAMAGQGGAGGGGLGGLLGMASNAGTAYNLATGGFGSMLFGNAAAYSALTPGLTIGGQQAAMLAAQTGEFGIAGATATAQAGGAGAGGFGALLSNPMVVAGAALAAAAAFGLFRKTVKRGDVLTGTLGVDDGIRSGDLMRKDGFLFGGPDWFLNDTGVSGLDKAIQAQWSASLQTVEQWSKALGLSTDKIEGFTATLGTETLGDHGAIGIRLDNDGTPLSDQEIQAKIAEAIRSGSNELAQQLIGTWETSMEEVTSQVRSSNWDSADGLYSTVTEQVERSTYTPSEFARDGEQAIDTLERLGTSIVATTAALQAIGQSAYEASLAGGDMASQLVDQFGSVDAFTASVGNFYSVFVPAQQQYQDHLQAVQGAFAGLNVAMPQSRAQFVDLVNALDLTTESGRETFAALMGVSDAFAVLLPDLSQLTGDLASTIADGMLGNFDGPSLGAAMAGTVSDGIYNAIAGGFAQQISAIIVQGVVEPVVMAAMTGSSVSAAVSSEAIAQMVAQAQAVADAAGQVMRELKDSGALDAISAAVSSISIPVGRATPAVQTYSAAVSSSGTSASTAADKIADAWRRIGDSLMDEVRRIRGVIADEGGNSVAYWQAQLATQSAMARAGDQDAAGRLTDISRSLLAAAQDQAANSLELAQIRAAAAQSLQTSAQWAQAYAGGSATPLPSAASAAPGGALAPATASGQPVALTVDVGSLLTELRLAREQNRAQAAALLQAQEQIRRLLQSMDDRDAMHEADDYAITIKETTP